MRAMCSMQLFGHTCFNGAWKAFGSVAPSGIFSMGDRFKMRWVAACTMQTPRPWKRTVFRMAGVVNFQARGNRPIDQNIGYAMGNMRFLRPLVMLRNPKETMAALRLVCHPWPACRRTAGLINMPPKPFRYRERFWTERNVCQGIAIFLLTSEMPYTQISRLNPFRTRFHATEMARDVWTQWRVCRTIPMLAPSFIVGFAESTRNSFPGTARNTTGLHGQPLHRLKRDAWARSGVAPRLTRVSKTLPSQESIAQL